MSHSRGRPVTLNFASGSRVQRGAAIGRLDAAWLGRVALGLASRDGPLLVLFGRWSALVFTWPCVGGGAGGCASGATTGRAGDWWLLVDRGRCRPKPLDEASLACLNAPSGLWMPCSLDDFAELGVPDLGGGEFSVAVSSHVDTRFRCGGVPDVLVAGGRVAC